MADAMRKIVRGNDQLARIGPDSFAVIVKGDGKAGRLVGERMRAGVEKVRVKIGKSHLRVTTTVSGLSLSDLEDGAGADAMLAAAHRLLQPKRSGRGNRTEWYHQVEMRRRA